MLEGTLLVGLLLLLLLFAGPIALFFSLAQKSEIARLTRDLESVRGWAFGLEQRVARLEAPGPVPDVEQARREAKRRAVHAIVGEPEPAAAPAPMPAPPPVSPAAEVAPPLPPPAEPAPEPRAAEPTPVNEPPPAASGPGWEHWIGVRGAAALGALVLVLAGLYFFRFSIEKGLLTPPLRVALGTLTGVACLLGAERWLRRSHALLANWIAGAGVAILYASFWAAASRYGLIGVPVAAGLMVLVTATSCLLAVRHGSIAIALLGLLGGFATPALLSTGTDRPLALFSYLLVLDAALLLVARAKRWPTLALLSLLGTAAYQGLWIVGRMGPERLALGLGILAVFAALYAVFARARDEASELWRLTRTTALLAPFLFALYFGLSAELAPRFWLTGAYLAVLVAGAAWVSRHEGRPWLELAATSAALGSMVAWLVAHPLSAETAWELMGVSIAIGAILLGFAERRGPRAPSFAVPIWTAGASIAIAVAAALSPPMSPWVLVIGWVLLAAIAVYYARYEDRGAVHLSAALALGASLAVVDWSHAGAPSFAPPSELLLACVALAAGFALIGLAPVRRESRRWQGHAAATLALILLGHQALLIGSVALPTPIFLAGTLLLGLTACFAAARSRAGAWMLVAVALTAAVQTPMLHALPAVAGWELWIALGFELLAVLAFTAWVFALPAGLREDRWLWRAAALAGPVFFPAMRVTFEHLGGKGVIALVPIALAMVSVAAVYGMRVRGPRDAGVRRSAVAWLGATALGFVTVAVPLQLENEWVTLAWALQGAVTLVLWRRVDHVGLKLFAVGLLSAVTVRLAMNPAVLDYHVRGPLPIVNWLSYTYLVPAACLFGAWYALAGVERGRLRRWETELFPERVLPWAAKLCAVFGFAVVFVWLNLTIIDFYSTGPALRVALQHEAARDLCMSVAWASYALVLLSIGVRRASTGLRALSLALMLVTCAKVFLYDLSHLDDLYRVASLVGLALSLIVVSLAYQRFVFGKREAMG